MEWLATLPPSITISGLLSPFRQHHELLEKGDIPPGAARALYLTSFVIVFSVNAPTVKAFHACAGLLIAFALQDSMY